MDLRFSSCGSTFQTAGMAISEFDVKGNYKTQGWKRMEKSGLYIFVLKLLPSACSHKETGRAMDGEGGGGGDWQRGAGGGDEIAVAHKE